MAAVTEGPGAVCAAETRSRSFSVELPTFFRTSNGSRHVARTSQTQKLSYYRLILLNCSNRVGEEGTRTPS
jgi:hypothetical protein